MLIPVKLTNNSCTVPPLLRTYLREYQVCWVYLKLFHYLKTSMEGEEKTLSQIAMDLKVLVKLALPWKKWHKLAHKSRDRYYRLRQLVTTEAQYQVDLNLIQQKIITPLKDCGAISEYDQNEMFPQIQGMIQLSKHIYQSMNSLLGPWNRRTTLIGPEMITVARFMIVYSEYFKRYGDTQRKLKLLVENNEQVKKIQQQIVEPPKMQTFLNMISKPFYRSLKYHLIIKDYEKYTPEGHPDKKYLQQAIAIYHQVNERNNNDMVHKQKSETLMALDKIFTNVINSDARYFITECQANILDINVKCYILSDLVLISQREGEKQIEYARVQLNDSSYTSILQDGAFMKNRLLLCGKKVCVHLEFPDKEDRGRFLTYLNGVIMEIYKSEQFKEEVKYNIRVRPSSILSTIAEMEQPRQTLLAEMRDSDTSEKQQTVSQQPDPPPRVFSGQFQHRVTRVSMNLKNTTLWKPPKIVVLGPVKRCYSSSVCKIYFLVKFQMPFPNEYHQYLYLDEEQIDKILKISKIVYFKERELADSPSFRELQEIVNNAPQIQYFQYISLYYTLLFNTIFRHPHISKRLDIYAHIMGVSEGLWLYLKYPHLDCPCSNCREAAVLNTIDKYKMELQNRHLLRRQTEEMIFYCPYRTFHVQDALLTMNSQDIVLGVDRLFWIKCEKGCLEYRLLDNYPLFCSPTKDVIFQVSYGLLPMRYEKKITRQDRVGQIKSSLSRDLNMDLTEYEVFMEINSASYMLGDDEILWSLLENEQQPESGITGFFRNTFGTKEDPTIKLVLKRVWWLIHSQPDIDNLQKIDLRMDLFMESLAGRAKMQEIQFSLKDLIYFQACYLLYKTESKISLTHLESLEPPKKWKLMDSKVKKDKLLMIASKMQKISQDIIKTKGEISKKNVFEYVVKIFRDKPIWGVYIFEGTTQLNERKIPVQVGFDLFNFIVKESGKVTNIYSCRLKQALEKIVVSSWQLRIKNEEEQLLIEGSQFVQMVPLLELYVQFANTFNCER